MWLSIITVTFILLDTSAGLLTRYGFEPHMPNLMSADSSDMKYDPPKRTAAGDKTWFRLWGQLDVTVESGADCFDQIYTQNCLLTHNRIESSSTVGLVYRSALSNFDFTKKYMFNVFVKPKKEAGVKWVDATIGAQIRNIASTQEPHKPVNIYTFGMKAFPRDESWIFLSFILEFSSDVQDKITDNELEVVDFRFKVEAGVDFYADAASLEVIDAPNWEADANEAIAETRRGVITILNYRDETSHVQVHQTRLGYPFGVAAQSKILGNKHSDEDMTESYKDWLADRTSYLTWGVFNFGSKWKAMEPDERIEGSDKFDEVDAALAWYKSHDISVRGHAIVWNKKDNSPSWTDGLDYDDLVEALNNRTEDIKHFTDFKHWDVCNEAVSDTYYDDELGISDSQKYFLDMAASHNVAADLFTNQFGNLQEPYFVCESVSANIRLNDKIQGVGVQGHSVVKDAEDPKVDIPLIKRRAELQVSSAGTKPVWITELTMESEDPTERAHYLEQMLTILYATPGIEGIVMWNFAPDIPVGHENYNNMYTALATPDIVNTEAGDRVDYLLGEKWKTPDQAVDIDPNHDYWFPAFHGWFDVTVDGASVDIGRLSPTRNDITINITDTSVVISSH